jgi:hypothetical protein
MNLKKANMSVERFLLILIILGSLYLLIKGLYKDQALDASGIDLNIKDLTLSVKNQLEQLDQERQKKNELPLFMVESFDLELNFTVKQVATKEGKLEYKVLTIGDKNEVSKEQVQKITLHMKANKPLEDSTAAD